MQQFQAFFHMPQAKALLRFCTAFAIIGNDDVEPARFQSTGDGHFRRLAMTAGIGDAFLHDAVDDFLLILPQFFRPPPAVSDAFFP